MKAKLFTANKKKLLLGVTVMALCAAGVFAGVKANLIHFVAAEELWTTAGILQMLVGGIFSSIIGYFVWWLQTRATRIRAESADITRKNLERQVEYEQREKRQIAEGHERLLERVSVNEKTLRDFSERIALMDQTVRPLFEAAKMKLIEALTHPSREFKIPDDLLDKVAKNTITKPEMVKLEALLKERETSIHPEVTPEERLAAAILPTVVQLVDIERNSVEPLTTMQLVSTSAKSEPEPEPEK